jgi:excisionase family DNA binding protein
MEIMTLKKAAAYLGLNPEVLRRKAANGTIPASRLGSAPQAPWRFYREELDQYLKWEVPATSPDSDQKSLLADIWEKFYKSDDEDTKIEALHDIAELNDVSTVPWLCEILLNADNDSPIIFWAIRTLTIILGQDADRYLLRFRDYEDPWIRIEVARFFAVQLNDKRACEYLQKYYKDSHSFLVLQTLLEIAPQKFMHELDTMLTNDNDPMSRQLALRELQKIEHPDQNLFLKQLLQDKDTRIRELAIIVTGEKKLQELIPSLQEIINSDDTQSIKKLAAQALSRIFSQE